MKRFRGRGCIAINQTKLTDEQKEWNRLRMVSTEDASAKAPEIDWLGEYCKPDDGEFASGFYDGYGNVVYP